MHAYFLIYTLLLGVGGLCKLSNALNEFGVCLLDLQLSEVLRLKKSVDSLNERHELLETMQHTENNTLNSSRMSPVHGQQCTLENCVRPTAMALVAATEASQSARGYSTSYGAAADYHPWKPEEKPSKLQTLFQISVTALAFMSFGGYLLCLIVQAIKSKGTTYFHPVASATATTMDGGLRRIKIYRRSRRSLPKRSPMLYNAYYPLWD